MLCMQLKWELCNELLSFLFSNVRLSGTSGIYIKGNKEFIGRRARSATDGRYILRTLSEAWLRRRSMHTWLTGGRDWIYMDIIL